MIYRFLYSRLIYPAYHWALRDGANSAIRELDHNEKLSAEALNQVCRYKLKRLVEFAARNVPYYRNVINDLGMTADEAGDPSNFARIPVLTKSLVHENRELIVSENLDGNGLDPNSTGGSTGEVFRFYSDWRSGSYRKATVRRNKCWLGILPGDPEVRLWGAPLDLDRAKSLRGTFHSLITREKLLSAYSMDDVTLQSYFDYCVRFKPKLLIAYPSALVVFARFCESQSQSIGSLRAIVCSAESLIDEDRKFIESVFGVSVYDRYGCREVGDIAQEAPGASGLLVNSDRVLVEVLDKVGNPCAPGVQGEVFVTDLDNYGMPLIRYRIGDYARWAEHDAHANSRYPFPVLASVDGRTLDVVRCPGGQRVGGTYWTILLRNQAGMKRFQVVQDEVAKLRVMYERETGSALDLEAYRKDISKTCGPEMQVEFIETDKFEHEPGTKFRLVLCRVQAS